MYKVLLKIFRFPIQCLESYAQNAPGISLLFYTVLGLFSPASSPATPLPSPPSTASAALFFLTCRRRPPHRSYPRPSGVDWGSIRFGLPPPTRVEYGSHAFQVFRILWPL